MAIIGKIREKSVLLVVIIGLALLAFILGNYDCQIINENIFSLDSDYIFRNSESDNQTGSRIRVYFKQTQPALVY